MNIPTLTVSFDSIEHAAIDLLQEHGFSLEDILAWRQYRIEKSIRDTLAIAAISGITARMPFTSANDAAKKAYEIADAMLVEREIPRR